MYVDKQVERNNSRLLVERYFKKKIYVLFDNPIGRNFLGLLIINASTWFISLGFKSNFKIFLLLL